MCCWTCLTHPIPHFTLSSPLSGQHLPIYYVSSFEAYLNGLLSFPYFSILVLLSGALSPDINFIVMIPLLVSCWESFPVWLPWFLRLEGAQRDTFWPCRWTWINIKCMKGSQRHGDICFVKWTLLEAVGLCWKTKGEMRTKDRHWPSWLFNMACCTSWKTFRGLFQGYWLIINDRLYELKYIKYIQHLKTQA